MKTTLPVYAYHHSTQQQQQQQHSRKVVHNPKKQVSSSSNSTMNTSPITNNTSPISNNNNLSLEKLPSTMSSYYNYVPMEIPMAIQEKLQEYERKNNVKILYCVETGSHSYGYHCESLSDFDIRFVYSSSLRDYLKLRNMLATYRGGEKSKIPTSIQNIFKCNVNPIRCVDILGWELRRSFSFIWSGNSSILEWLASERVLVSRTNNIDRLKNVAAKIIHGSPYTVAYAKLNTAKKNYHNILDSKDKPPTSQRDVLDVKKTLFIIQTLLSVNILEWKYLINTNHADVAEPLENIIILNFRRLFDTVKALRTIEIEKEIEELYLLRQQVPNVPLSSLHFGQRVESWIVYELNRVNAVCSSLFVKHSKDRWAQHDQAITDELDALFLDLLLENDKSFTYHPNNGQ
ncbi:predicted protein [Naegleria gruberi]|uniref:Predicted protein n=1 Tax=Naegleria gruberi TaxID=5762 RepID=D2V7A9_NAEGR|nr:uncharacterized protein NAEGRDRAFT_64730 [Naegleria gruberi]EFC47343.1 predicted protein [Naegleria gruberi]|eukprot:XP_002680087.1 predicted protein [Naegleria gruberi strain NEG-M]